MLKLKSKVMSGFPGEEEYYLSEARHKLKLARRIADVANVSLADAIQILHLVVKTDQQESISDIRSGLDEMRQLVARISGKLK